MATLADVHADHSQLSSSLYVATRRLKLACGESMTWRYRAALNQCAAVRWIYACDGASSHCWLCKAAACSSSERLSFTHSTGDTISNGLDWRIGDHCHPYSGYSLGLLSRWVLSTGTSAYMTWLCKKREVATVVGYVCTTSPADSSAYALGSRIILCLCHVRRRCISFAWTPMPCISILYAFGILCDIIWALRTVLLCRSRSMLMLSTGQNTYATWVIIRTVVIGLTSPQTAHQQPRAPRAVNHSISNDSISVVHQLVLTDTVNGSIATAAAAAVACDIVTCDIGWRIDTR